MLQALSRSGKDTKKGTALSAIPINPCCSLTRANYSATTVSATTLSQQALSQQALSHTTVSLSATSAVASVLLPQDAKEIAETATNKNANFFIFFAF